MRDIKYYIIYEMLLFFSYHPETKYCFMYSICLRIFIKYGKTILFKI